MLCGLALYYNCDVNATAPQPPAGDCARKGQLILWACRSTGWRNSGCGGVKICKTVPGKSNRISQTAHLSTPATSAASSAGVHRLLGSVRVIDCPSRGMMSRARRSFPAGVGGALSALHGHDRLVAVHGDGLTSFVGCLSGLEWRERLLYR